jgi:hypothetical protein
MSFSSWKKFLPAFALGVSVLAFNTPIHAHGSSKPEHGGVVQISGETLLELVVRPDSVDLYVKDDDDEVASAGLTAKLTIVSKGAKTEVPMQAAAGNKFEAKGLKLVGGSKVSVLVVNKNTQAKIGATFSVD